MADSRFIDADPMRISRTRTCLGNGQWSEWHEGSDLRGTPIGDKAEVWEYDRLVYPRRTQCARRVREYITVMHCPEGWYATSGTADEPSTAICSTLLDAKWTARGFPRNFIATTSSTRSRVIQVKRHTTTRTLRYCNPELPAEYRAATES